MEELKRQKIEGNTLVMFMSDNGRPFPRDKTTIYDSGIKTPFIVRWPGHVKPGSMCASLVSTIDIAPTFLDVAGLASGEPFQGKSFRAVLKDPSANVRKFAFAEQNWHDYEAHARAVRGKRFKLIRTAYTDLPLTPSADGVRSPMYQTMTKLRTQGKLSAAQSVYFTLPRPKEELYDCAVDPHELQDLAGNSQYDSIRDELGSALDQWVKDTKDYVPILRTADEFDRTTGLPTPARVRPRLSKAQMVEKGLAAP